MRGWSVGDPGVVLGWSLDCPWVVLGLSLGCPGVVLGLSLGGPGVVLGLSLGGLWVLRVLSLGGPGVVLEIIQTRRNTLNTLHFVLQRASPSLESGVGHSNSFDDVAPRCSTATPSQCTESSRTEAK